METPLSSPSRAAHYRVWDCYLSDAAVDEMSDGHFGSPVILSSLHRHFRSKGIVLKHGDIVTLDMKLDEEDPAYGNLIFDGAYLVPVIIENGIGYGNRALMAIVDFPIHYWDGILETKSVHFSFDTVVRFQMPELVMKIGKIFYYPFDYEGRSYQIVSDYDTDQELTPLAFLAGLMDLPNFQHTPSYLVDLTDPLLVPSDSVIYYTINDVNEYATVDSWDMSHFDQLTKMK